MKRNKSQTYILKTVAECGECHVGWRSDFGQRLRQAMYDLRREGLIQVYDIRHFKDGRVSALVKASAQEAA